jgi:O-antigen ligase
MDRKSAFAELWPVLVVLAVAALLPVGRLAELPLLVAALVALVRVARGRLDWRAPGPERALLVVFACWWGAAFVSGIDAVAPARTWTTIGVGLRYLPFAWFAGWALRDASCWRGVTTAVAAIVTLWLLDAWVQMALGFGLGGAAEAERVSGIFGADNLKLGPVLAVLSPFVLLAARRKFGHAGLATGFVLLLGPILMAGSRAAWIAFAIVCGFVAWHETRRFGRFALAILAAIAIALVAGGIARQDSARFDARMERSLLALEGSTEALDEASAGRVRIWRAALAMTADHPFNGVGVRGFRYAYPDYAAPGDAFVDPATATGAAHAHQILLEVLSETGVAGMLLWLAGAWTGVHAWRRADAAARERARAPALALAAMCFPLNSHLAFYSTWWSLVFWWLIALYFAALGADRKTTRA